MRQAELLSSVPCMKALIRIYTLHELRTTDSGKTEGCMTSDLREVLLHEFKIAVSVECVRITQSDKR